MTMLDLRVQRGCNMASCPYYLASSLMTLLFQAALVDFAFLTNAMTSFYEK